MGGDGGRESAFVRLDEGVGEGVQPAVGDAADGTQLERVYEVPDEVPAGV